MGDSISGEKLLFSKSDSNPPVPAIGPAAFRARTSRNPMTDRCTLNDGRRKLTEALWDAFRIFSCGCLQMHRRYGKHLGQSFMDFFASNQTSLKICGVRTQEDAMRLIDLGVDAVGLNFWPLSKRYLNPEDAGWLKDLAGDILRVGVFVNQGTDLPHQLVTQGLIDLVQLHGDESVEEVRELTQRGVRVVKALGVRDSGDIEKAGAYGLDAILLDAHAPQVFGGTGEKFDWGLALEFRKRFPDVSLILAGGITPQNAASAISEVRPAALDVASGAEVSPGVKDFHKVQLLLDACRNAI